MRSRERLIEILYSVNVCAIGVSALHAKLLHWAADMLNGLAWSPVYIDYLTALAKDNSASPHLRELATEALHYLREDADAPHRPEAGL